MRLNKYISETGICSRREADEWIANGRVSINGIKAELGTQVGDGDEVTVDRQRIGSKPKSVYLMLNKPVGITCTTERHIQGNIIDFVGHEQRIFPVGRLDKDSEGLILLTNNGDIINQLLRTENHHEKEYVVTVDKPVTEAFLKRMAGGVRILDTMTKPCKIKQTGKCEFTIILTQGLNRQIRRMCEVLSYSVRHLRRVRFVNLKLGAMKTGQWRNLTEAELSKLMGLEHTRAHSPASPATERLLPRAKPQQAKQRQPKRLPKQ
jgi:23S rRNA pseudouridine2604 synthase